MTVATPAEVEQLLAKLPDKISNAGRELTLQIAPAVAGRWEATRPGTQRICTAICRLAKRHHHAAEQLCEGGDLEAAGYDRDEIEREQHGRELRMSELVAALPPWTEHERGPLHSWGVDFEGDPRGCTVKLTGPRSVYDSWGGDGVCVPQH